MPTIVDIIIDGLATWLQAKLAWFDVELKHCAVSITDNYVIIIKRGGQAWHVYVDGDGLIMLYGGDGYGANFELSDADCFEQLAEYIEHDWAVRSW